MNQNQLEAAAEERWFEAMLDEVVQERVAARGTRERGRSRWLAAALMLLGLAVVVGVLVTSRSGSSVAVEPQEQEQEQEPEQLPSAVSVGGLAELQRADRRTVHLTCALEGPDFGLLREFTALRALHVELGDLPTIGTLFQGAWSLAPLVGCTKLESLSIGHLNRFAAPELAPIGILPKLRSLELAGREKVLDAAFVAVLAKLPLRSLVLNQVHIESEGLQAIGELPLLERLELRDCSGLEACELKHLYRLRQLRVLTLVRVGDATPRSSRINEKGTGILVELPQLGADGRPIQSITAAWMRGLAKALPELRELDLSQSRIDDDVLAELPRGVRSLRLVSTPGFGERGVAAVGALPELRNLACSDPQGHEGPPGALTIATWRPLLLRKKLHRFEYTGFAGLLAEELRGQTELEELRFDQRVQWSFHIRGGGQAAGPAVEEPVPDFGCLAGLAKLRKIELRGPSPTLEAAIRKAVPPRVAIEILPR